MTIASLLDAFETVAYAEQLQQRLEAAWAELAKKQGLREEKSWLETALARVAAGREGVGTLLTRVLRLPEMDPVRDEHGRTLQHAAVDAVEKLHAGITFAGGSRAPLLEALYGRLKLPVLRRCDREDFARFCADFEKRLSTSYARRMFGDASFALVAPVLEQVHAAFATWRGVYAVEALPEAEAQALRDELDAAARRLELPVRQARLLAEAALAPIKDLFELSGIGQRPKKRVPRPVVVESDDDFEGFGDPTAPSADELAELQGDAPPELPEEEPAEAPAPPPAVEERPRRRRKAAPPEVTAPEVEPEA